MTTEEICTKIIEVGREKPLSLPELFIAVHLPLNSYQLQEAVWLILGRDLAEITTDLKLRIL